MKKCRRIICSVLLCLSLVLSLAAVPASAEEAASGGNGTYNIVLAMDCSGSLIQGNCSDPDGYRYEAVSMFLDMLTESGNIVSVILFNGNTSLTDTSDQAMESGLRENTPLEELTCQDDKDALKSFIKNKTFNGKPAAGYTDYGTALKAAAEKLEGLSKQNGKPSVIILFTDGFIETKDKVTSPKGTPDSQLPVYSKALENLATAESKILQEGIELCCVYLDYANEELTPEELEDRRETAEKLLDMVRRANDCAEFASVEQVGDRFIHVTDASSLPDAYRRFFAVFSGAKQIPFRDRHIITIPQSGVGELNISIIASGISMDHSRSLLDQLSLTITRPDRTSVSSAELSEMISRSSTYAVCKIRDLVPGDWIIEVDSPAGYDRISSNLILNVDASASMRFSADPDKSVKGKPFMVSATLASADQTLTDASAYAGYQCTLYLRNITTGQSFECPMGYVSSMKGYACEVTPQSFGEYSAQIVFRCGDDIELAVAPVSWSVFNHDPVAPADLTVPITVGLGAQGYAEVNLRTLETDVTEPGAADEPRVTDAETALSDLAIQVDLNGYNPDAVEQNGDVMRINGAVGKGGVIQVTYHDTDGGSCTTELRIDYTDNTVKDVLLVILAIVLIFAVLLLLRLVKHKFTRLDGRLSIVLPLANTAGIPLKRDAQDSLNFSLKAILEESLGSLVIGASERGCPDGTVQKFLEQNDHVLSNVKIRAAYSKEKKRFLCLIVGAEGRGSRKILSNGESVEIAIRDSRHPLRITYERYQ